mmetsp:Transcript_13809/g.38280  ORF Transcript_13809/g.38280 Transcript_13809/m.38280 type:complete len:105 (-) Transcript_13809:17-331(-)
MSKDCVGRLQSLCTLTTRVNAGSAASTQGMEAPDCTTGLVTPPHQQPASHSNGPLQDPESASQVYDRCVQRSRKKGRLKFRPRLEESSNAMSFGSCPQSTHVRN